jgi:hypothetical protein
MNIYARVLRAKLLTTLPVVFAVYDKSSLDICWTNLIAASKLKFSQTENSTQRIDRPITSTLASRRLRQKKFGCVTNYSVTLLT